MKNLLSLIFSMVFCLSITGNLHAATSDDGDLLSVEFVNTLMDRIRSTRLEFEKDALEAEVAEYLSKTQANGTFSDVSFSSGTATSYLTRWKKMAVAYTEPGNMYYEDETVYRKIEAGLLFWYNTWPKDGNWWHNTIGYPNELGLVLVALYPGKIKFQDTQLYTDIKQRWLNDGDIYPPNKGGDQGQGANKIDIVMSWVYICGVGRDKANFEFALNDGYSVADYTTSGGIQHDNSYRQHGAQLYIGGYGTALIGAIVPLAYYMRGTEYAMSKERAERLSSFILNAYLPTIRGHRMSFNAMGRQLTRTHWTDQGYIWGTLELLKEIDPAAAEACDIAIERFKTKEPAHGINPFHTHFYRGEYTVHQRPGYSFDVRMVSKRMHRSEYDKNEARMSFFRTDGATSIMVDGEEYGSIIPMWDWTKIPGITLPAFTTKPDPLTAAPLPSSLRRADNYISSGRSDYAGGVTDGLYGVTAFDMVNDMSLYAYNDPNGTYGKMAPLDFGAKKSWFIFDKEIVCLGAGVRSSHEGLNVYTTVNQCRKTGPVMVNNGVVFEQGMRTQQYPNLSWVLNDKIAYYFPGQGDVYVSNEARKASWSDVNHDGSGEKFTENVFSLYIDHGVEPEKGEYSYIIVPNINTAEEAKNYPVGNIEILSNTDSVQAVYHKELDMYGFAFYGAAHFKGNGIEMDVDAPCVVLVKDAGQNEASVYAANPCKSGKPINIGIRLPNISGMKGIVYPKVEEPHTGKSIEFKINETTPVYEGRDVYTPLDRSGWTITTSLQGPADDKVGGNKPEYIIDGDEGTCFLFVKPGKTWGGVNAPGGTFPSFTIDMQSPQEFNYFQYRHRTYDSATTTLLRASKVSFYGKNSEADDFSVIMKDIEIPVSEGTNEVYVTLPAKVNYRYVKLEINDWHRTGGSTIQVSEFDLGTASKIGGEESGIGQTASEMKNLAVYPNPVVKGGLVKIASAGSTPCLVEVKDLYGKTVYSGSEPYINTASLSANIYIVMVKDKHTGEIIGSSKLVVK